MKKKKGVCLLTSALTGKGPQTSGSKRAAKEADVTVSNFLRLLRKPGENMQPHSFRWHTQSESIHEKTAVIWTQDHYRYQQHHTETEEAWQHWQGTCNRADHHMQTKGSCTVRARDSQRKTRVTSVCRLRKPLVFENRLFRSSLDRYVLNMLPSPFDNHKKTQNNSTSIYISIRRGKEGFQFQKWQKNNEILKIRVILKLN